MNSFRFKIFRFQKSVSNDSLYFMTGSLQCQILKALVANFYSKDEQESILEVLTSTFNC